MKKHLILTFLFLSSVILSACTAANVDEQVYPLLLSVDKGENSGYSVNIKIPYTGQGQGEDKLSSSDGETISAALSSLDASTPQELSFYQLKYIVFSSELAYSDNFSNLLQDITQIKGLKPGASCYISDVPASEFLKSVQPFMGERLSKTLESQEQMLKKASLITGHDLFATDRDFISPYKTPLAVSCTLSDGAASVIGSIVFEKKAAIKTLSGYETQLLLMCMGDFSNAAFTLDLDNRLYDIELKRGWLPKIKTQNTDPISVSVDVRLYAFNRSANNLPADFEALAANRLAQDIADLLSNIYSLGGDPLGIAGDLSKNYPTINDFEAANITERLKNTAFSVSVHVQQK